MTSKIESNQLKTSTLDQLKTTDREHLIKGVQNGMTRRQALTFLTAAGVTAANAGLLFSEAGSVAAATPKKGGTLKFANNIHGPDDQMDPVLFTSGIDYARGRTTYNSLIQHDENLTPQPELAESFEPNSNATEWTFKIRKGVKFHDGSALTADDVVWSMNRHLGENSVSVIKAVLASVKEWKKTGSHEVKAIMNTPNADLPTLLGVFQSKIVKKDTTDFHKGNGTGPFRLESFNPGDKSLHVRNEDYWRKPANFDAIEITAITDPVARVNALIAGDMDMISQVDPKAIRQIEGASGVRVSSVPAGLYIGICCLKNTAPGNNDDFVRGLQYIQDRERVVKRVLKGHGTIGNDQPIMSAYGADFCSELPQRQFDPDKAKFHFKKAGVSGAEIHVAPVASGIEDMCLMAQANAAKIGFDLKVKKVPSDGYWGAVWMKEPINVVTWNMRPTANAMMSIQFAPGAAWNDTFWNNERFGDLLKLSLAETDPDKRHALYCEMQTLVHNGSGMVIPAHINIIDGVNEKIKGIPNVPLGNTGAFEWPEFAWFA